MQEPGAGSDAPARSELDPYAVLGTSKAADALEIARAYRRALRRTHPDMGGTAEEFAAVQEAWRALRDPADHAGEDGARDEWAVGGWGVAIDEPAQASAAERSTQGGAAGTEPDDAAGSSGARGSERDTDPGGEETQGPRDIGSPFAPGAIELPEPELRAPAPARAPRFGTVDRSLRLGVLGSGLGSMAILLVAGPRLEGTALAGAGFLVLLALYSVFVQRVNGARGLWPVALISVGLVVWIIVTSFSTLSSAAILLLLYMAVGVVALNWLLLRKEHRAEIPRSRMNAARRVGSRLDQHHLAAEWNISREALRTPGARVERLLESSSRGGSWRGTFVDPQTMRTSDRKFDRNLPEGTWVVFGGTGEVLATAPSNAPEAWQRVLKVKR